jgi:putative nucleotidyltransferase with HDIG domain
MIKEWDNIELDYDFLNEKEENYVKTYGSYKVLISDDEPEVHNVTKMILKDFVFENHTLEFLDAYSEAETIKAFEQHKDIAVLFQDVVMEKNSTGLHIINYLRHEMRNQMTRIILRTGQPGEAPEETVIKDYDINDYCLKTDLTVARLKTIMLTALRGYRDIIRLDRYRRGLEKIIETSANLFTHHTLSDFLTSILNHLSGFYYETEGIMYIREETEEYKHNGFVTMEQSNTPIVVAATGNYVRYIGRNIKEIDELSSIYQWMLTAEDENSQITFVGKGFIIRNNSNEAPNNYIFIEGDKELYNFDLIKLFLSNYSVALDNYLLNNMIFNAQKEIIVTLGGIAEKHFDETGEHVDRVSEMMYNFARILGYPSAECEKVKLASILHDIGKIGLPDSILKKPGKLTEEEFNIIKEHTKMGYEMLSKSNLEILHMASEIALCHHEKYDGTGYPRGLKGEEIPEISRMLAIIDVYDAMCHKRVYKEASSHKEALEYIESHKDQHFDRRLADIFFDNYEDITV